MPNYSFSTVLMALLTSSLLVVLIALCFCSKKILMNAGYKLLGLFVILVLLRLLFPFEFPFTSNLNLPEAPSKAIALLQTNRFAFRNRELSVWNLLELLWTAGIAVTGIILIKRQIQFKNYIQKNAVDKTEDELYRKILDGICIQYKKPNSFRIIELPGVTVPFIFGIKHPCIVLPPGLSLPPEQLYYVICHEALHFFRHDLLIKGGIRILSVLYWWNPAFLLLWKQVDTLMEMRTDQAITKGSPEKTIEYTDCLLCVKKASQKNTLFAPPRKNTFSLLKPRSHALKDRFAVLLRDTKPGSRICIGSILIILVAGIYLTSYLYILEAHYIPPEIRAVNEISPETSYFIKTGSSSYELYFYDYYIDTISNVHLYPPGIKIYNEKGEYINEN